MAAGFVHLDVRSFFSLKEGAFSPEQLAQRAAALGMPAVAMTDRDGLYGAARFVRACADTGVRPILGASLTVRADDQPVQGRDAHVVLLAEDHHGYANLCRLVTDAQLLGERGDPSITVPQICAHAAGMTVVLGPRSHPGRLAVRGQVDAAAALAAPFRDAFGPARCVVAAEHRLEPGSDTEIRAMLRLAERLRIPALATNPVRYLVADDAFLADALECMRRIVPVAAANVSRRNAEGYLKPAAAMRALFAERPDLCDATLDVAERCGFDLGLGRLHFPGFPTPAGRSADALLAERCWRGVHERGMTESEPLRERLHLELSMIRQMGYAAYFLTVADIVADVKSMGIMAACRGSAAGSLVCYLVGISDVDALRHDLAFERFLNPMRDELPDVDIDVESARREDVYDMILSRHGQERAACVAMIDTYRARAAIREVGKALGLPETEVGVVATAFPHISARNLRSGLERLPELRGINLPVRQLDLLFRVAERLDGFPRHIALHPCGIVLASHDLVERVPLERSANGHRMAQADKDDVELLGYLKLDILGVRMLSSMRHALDEIARTTGEKVDLDRIPLDDPSTFALIRASDTLGCFQIESPGQRELLQKLQPVAFEDLIVDISLFRPGPVKSDMIRPYIARRMGLQRPTYIHPELRPALQETFGVIVFHEQVMRTLAALAGYDLTYADHVRRHLDDEAMLPGLRADFLTKAVARGVDPAAAGATWDAVAQFASFGFCKAHAAAFAVPTYRSSWLKAHHPAHFLAGVLTHDPGMYPRRLLLDDARRHGVPILPLDVNRSEPEYVVEEVDEPTEAEVGPRSRCAVGAKDRGSSDGSTGARAASSTRDPRSLPASERYGIRLGLQDVHGISQGEIRSILAARAERPFRDVGDLLRRTVVSRPVAEALAHAGAFDALPGGNRREHLYEAITVEAPHEGDQLTLGLASSADALGGAASRGMARQGQRGGPSEQHRFADYTDAEIVKAELEVLGLDVTRHVVSFFEPLLADLGVTRARDLHRCRQNAWVMVAGVKIASQTPAVRSGQRIIFVSLDDATGPIEVTVFESVQPKVARTVFHAYALAVWGQLRRTGVQGMSVTAEEVWDLTELHRARGEGRLREALAAPVVPRAPARRLWHASPGSAG
ncbi:MAG TPA: DNA polymerase III subunit alpha [Actinomycetota bacterium]|nr:DNA polymerase III subunit alpha [Actinomycetota bacterium]